MSAPTYSGSGLDRSLDMSTLQKRLGDGFYEQKLVNDQIIQLTGKRFLAGYQDSQRFINARGNVCQTTTINIRGGVNNAIKCAT